MIIKNNFNEHSVNPLDNYKEVGKGSNSLDKILEKEKEGFIKKNMDNKVIQDIINSDNEYNQDDKKEDKWDFFR